MKTLEAKPIGLLEKKFSAFSEGQRRFIMGNLGAFQLTEGCSIGCTFCGFEAKQGVSEYIPPSTVTSLIADYASELGESEPFLYYASDPFDYDFESTTYVDIHNSIKAEVGYSPYVSTAIPFGKEQYVLRLLLEQRPKWDSKDSLISRISLSNMNQKRVQETMESLVPALRDKGLQEKIDQGECGTYYAITLDSRNRVASPKPVTYKDVLSFFCPDTRAYDFTHGGTIKLGEKNKADLADRGIGCFHGFLMDPKGVYTVELVRPSAKHPQGQIVSEVDPNDFKGIMLDRFPWGDRQSDIKPAQHVRDFI